MHAGLDEDTYQVKQEFLSLEAWYLQGVGSDFAKTYSLAALDDRSDECGGSKSCGL